MMGTNNQRHPQLDMQVVNSILTEFGDESYPEDFYINNQMVEYLEGLQWSAVKLNVKRRYGNAPPNWLHNWVTCYHGTGESGMKGILREGFDLGHAVRERYGPGIYTSPKFGTAASYARQKIFTQNDGCQYMVVLECRADPRHIETIEEENRIYFIIENEKHIRPVKLLYYYICEGYRGGQNKPKEAIVSCTLF